MTTDRDAQAGFFAARALLAFYQDAGVDSALGETPTDRFAADPASAVVAAAREGAGPAGEAKVGTRAETGVVGSRGESAAAGQPGHAIFARGAGSKGGGTVSPPPSADAAVMTAREAAKAAANLDELRAVLDRFEGCALRATATRLVFADGTPGSRLMFVGEAPGRDEDIEGLPFVGRSGKLLDLMIQAIGLDRSCVYIANIIPWRPPGNRDPSSQESAICLPFIRRQIELADPDILVCLGKPSAVTLLDIKGGILQARGRWLPFHTGTREIRAMATLHPAYLLRQPLQKRLAWRDFLTIKKALAA